MLPISDVHFAFCGIATVAATLGYACARRAVFSLASPNEPSRADVEAGQTEERSLKRKLDDADEHDVDAEEQSRPVKRNKTPPTDQLDLDEDLYQEWEVVVAPPPPYEQAVGLTQPEEPNADSVAPQKEPLAIEQTVTPVEEPAPPARPETPAEQGAQARRSSTPQPPPINLSLSEPETPPPRPVTPPKPAAPAKIESVNAFSAFSGSASPFASYSKGPGASPFALSSQNTRSAPVWRCGNNDAAILGPARPANALASSPNDTVSSATTSPAPSQATGVLETPREKQSTAKSPSYLTGEEDEAVEAELKGVKLFVKRGQKDFTDGMYGHVKILTQKSVPSESRNNTLGVSTEINSRTRLLFRRDPLGQVSMNIGLHPTVRCHYDSAENILRVILMEQTTVDDKALKEDIAVYALKPGRAQKTEFQSFAKTLCDHKGLQSGIIASSAGSVCAAS